MASCELTQPLLQNEEIFDGNCYVNDTIFEDSSSGYESSDNSDSEFEFDLPEKSRDYKAPKNEDVSARIKSTHALCESLKLIMEIPEMCDVTFLVGPREVPVHGVRAILGTRSRLLYQLIIKHLNLRETGPKGTRSTVRAHGDRLTIPVRKYDAEVFRMLIQFVHSGTATITDTSVFGLLCGADQFELKDLEEACWEYIDKRLERGEGDVILSSAKAYQHHRKANEIFRTIYCTMERPKAASSTNPPKKFLV